MLYLTTPTARARDAIRAGRIGAMVHPDDKRTRKLAGIRFALDNGCFSAPWEVARWPWLRALYTWRALQADCLFATAPDVVGNAGRTLELAALWLPVLAELGYRPAFVAQDGLEDAVDRIPWHAFDVLFVGGTTAWKYSSHAYRIADLARTYGKRTHLGRVNSLRALRRARDAGFDTADGTFVAFAPDTNVDRVEVWLSDLERSPALDL